MGDPNAPNVVTQNIKKCMFLRFQFKEFAPKTDKKEKEKEKETRKQLRSGNNILTSQNTFATSAKNIFKKFVHLGCMLPVSLVLRNLRLTSKIDWKNIPSL